VKRGSKRLAGGAIIGCFGRFRRDLRLCLPTGVGNICPCAAVNRRMGDTMVRNRAGWLFAAVMLILGLALPTSAKAELKFCNKTSKKVDVAVGYKSNDKWVSEGWWGLDPGICKSPIKASLQKRYYYYYAESDDLTWQGDYIFCTSDKEFTIEGADECKSRGYTPEGFKEIDVGEDINHTIDLTGK
jgi:uncharacterized membrane protein